MKDVSRWIVSGILLLLVSSAAWAEEPKKAEEMRVRTFAIWDLVIPVQRHEEIIEGTTVTFENYTLPTAKFLKGLRGSVPPSPRPPQDFNSNEALIRYITTTTQPQCWAEVGGRCTIQHYARGQALVVNATQEILEEIGDLLQALRRQNTKMAFECKVVEIDKDGKLHENTLPKIKLMDEQAATIALCDVTNQANSHNCTTLHVTTKAHGFGTLAVKVAYEKLDRKCQFVDWRTGGDESKVQINAVKLESVETACELMPGQSSSMPLAYDAKGKPERWLVFTVRDVKDDDEAIQRFLFEVNFPRFR